MVFYGLEPKPEQPIYLTVWTDLFFTLFELRVKVRNDKMFMNDGLKHFAPKRDLVLL